MLGSPLYMSPEQLRRSKSVDHHSDIWAMGVILYELMTGTLPFAGESLGELFAGILETRPTPLSERVSEVSPGLDAIVMRCLEKLPEHRFHSARELAQALAPYASPGAVPESVPSFVPSTPRIPPGGAISGTGPQPLASGTVALGAITPMPYGMGGMQQSSSGWHQSSTTAGRVPKSKAPLFAALAFGTIFVVGMVFIVASTRHSRAKAEMAAAAAAAAVSSTPALPASAPPSATIAAVDPASSASSGSAGGAESPSGGASATSVPSVAPTKRVPRGLPTAKQEPAVPTAKPDATKGETKPEPPRPRPPPTRDLTNNGGNLQNAR
jgi:serine/threonine-protein kinase